MTFKQVKFILWQLFGMVVFVLAGAFGGYIYFVGEQKNAAKQEAPATTITVEHPQGEPELQEPTPVSISQPSNAERLTRVKAKAKSRQAKKQAQKEVQPVAYSQKLLDAKMTKMTPKEAARQRKMNAKYDKAKTAKATPAAQRPVALSKAQIRDMAINSADRLDYSAPEFRAELKEQAKSILQFRATDKNRPEQVVNREEQKK